MPPCRHLPDRTTPQRNTYRHVRRRRCRRADDAADGGGAVSYAYASYDDAVSAAADDLCALCTTSKAARPLRPSPILSFLTRFSYLCVFWFYINSQALLPLFFKDHFTLRHYERRKVKPQIHFLTHKSNRKAGKKREPGALGNIAVLSQSPSVPGSHFSSYSTNLTQIGHYNVYV